MRQGNDFHQRCERDNNGRLIITVPLELTEEFEDSEFVVFHAHGNGYFRLKPFKRVDK